MAGINYRYISCNIVSLIVQEFLTLLVDCYYFCEVLVLAKKYSVMLHKVWFSFIQDQLHS